MKFIVDEQLPRSLARFLTDAGHEAHHTYDLGLNSKSDAEVLQQARSLGAVIFTKDRDFTVLDRVADGPSIVWWRFGNEATPKMLERCAAVLPDILRRLAAGQPIVEVG